MNYKINFRVPLINYRILLMIRRFANLPLLCLVLLAAIGSSKANAVPNRVVRQAVSCPKVAAFDGADLDAAPALMECIDSVSPGAEIALPPGRYVLRSRVMILKEITLSTAGVLPSGNPCIERDGRRCAILTFIPNIDLQKLPFEISANDVHIDAVVFEGAKLVSPKTAIEVCKTKINKAAGGGLQVRGDNIEISRSVFRSFPCYTSVEYEGGYGTKFESNVFAGNGSHDSSASWADGLTVHDGRSLIISRNKFKDNTDVQLIFGGCQFCLIKENRFSHSGVAVASSFAELMFHAWPNATSGNFSGTRVENNTIDCRRKDLCGFGLMIGASPWYKAPTFGGQIFNNRISNTTIGININDLTGAMQFGKNRVRKSGGVFKSSCGLKKTKPINISDKSRKFALNMDEKDLGKVRFGSEDYSGCLFNYPDILIR
jgi:hypothetical protein